MAVMQAVVFDHFGGPEVLYVADVAQPRPLATEVLVRVEAAGINRADWQTRAGGGFAAMMGQFPLVLGWDLAGGVVEIGAGVTRFVPGDRVFGMVRFPQTGRAYAEYVTAPSRQLAHTPSGLSSIEAAGLPLSFLTAWQSLVDTAGVEPGQTVVIYAANSDVGQLAIQIAKVHGSEVIAIAAAESQTRLVSLGVDEFLADSEPLKLLDGHDLDIVLDLGGDRPSRDWIDRLRPGGILISPLITPACAEKEIHDAGVHFTRIMPEPDHVALEQLAHLISTGQVQLQVDEVFPLTMAGKAHELAEAGLVGKAILAI
jgi:NADPH:quinone reductase-like Zn-dependent oxidoreductase